MALENLISIQFDTAELAQIDEALATLKSVLLPKVINLTPEERQHYGCIAGQNKLLVNKAKSYMEQFPEYVPLFLDKAEFDRDYAGREQIEARQQLLNSLAEQLADTKTLLDYDNYHDALVFYRNIRYLANENIPGTNEIYNDMKQFFVAGATATFPQSQATE